ncbi:MAG: hypothetical protein E7468_01260 [Ruminococcaceae bacterium]|nr:hypothetical protein [Oscillospiraceae bacterium]
MGMHDKPPYYITAYGIAVKHGFKGTIEQWLASLHGDNVELRYVGDKLQWRRVKNTEEPEPEDGWQDLLDMTGTREEIFSKAQQEVLRAEAAAGESKDAADRAEGAAGRAEDAAGSAEASATSALQAQVAAEEAVGRSEAAAARSEGAAAEAANKKPKDVIVTATFEDAQLDGATGLLVSNGTSGLTAIEIATAIGKGATVKLIDNKYIVYEYSGYLPNPSSNMASFRAEIATAEGIKVYSIDIDNQLYARRVETLIAYSAEDAVTYTPQELNPEQQAQAQMNIGVDKLCPPFTESGSAVTCEPVEGYPLQVVSKIEPVQSGTGDPSPDNIRPISGHSAVKLTRSGKNLIDTKNPKICHTNPIDKAMDITLSDTGFTMVSVRDGVSPWFYLSYIIGTVKELTGKTITASADYTSSKSSDYNVPFLGIRQTNVEPCGNNNDITYQNGGYATDKSMPVLEGGVKSGTSVSYTVTGEETCKYVMFTMCFQYGGSLEVGDWVKYSNVQVEIGSTATAYEPYRGETFELDLGQTVYGGTLDWNTGVLTVDRKVLVVDGTELSFTDIGGDYWNLPYYVVPGIKSNMNLTNSHLPLYCFAPHPGSDFIYGRGQYIKNYGFESADALNAYLVEQNAAGTPLQIQYDLEEPITIQLTPQEILALSGINTLYSDTGDTEVTGRANPVAIISNLQSRLAALEAAVVNNA